MQLKNIENCKNTCFEDIRHRKKESDFLHLRTFYVLRIVHSTLHRNRGNGREARFGATQYRQTRENPNTSLSKARNGIAIHAASEIPSTWYASFASAIHYHLRPRSTDVTRTSSVASWSRAPAAPLVPLVAAS